MTADQFDRVATYIFIFEPHSNWDFMGGMMVIGATSFEHAVALYDEWKMKHEGGDFPNEEGGQIFEKEPPNTNEDWHKWVLSRKFRLYEATDSFVMQNGNYA